MKYLFTLLLSCLIFSVNGQFVEPKFGAVEMSDLTMKMYDKDTTAAALVLFNSGDARITVGNNQSWEHQYDRHCMIKIFKNSAFDVANIKIRLYRNKADKEELQNLTAVTYNLVDNKIVKTKLENKKIYRTQEDKYNITSFAFPEVKEGSIIELSYTINSPFLYNFRGWDFQYQYPARWSQYVYEIPEYFTYRESSKGFLNFSISDKTTSQLTIGVPKEVEVDNGRTGIKTLIRTAFVKVKAMKSVLAVKDVPAFKPEPNIDCQDNYIQSIEFELNTIWFPGETVHNYTETWESVNKTMLDEEDFGKALKNNRFLGDTINKIIDVKSGEIEKAAKIYDYARRRFKWNTKYSLWASDGLKKPFSERVGNSAELNLLLTAMLQNAGLNANPVLFSTRENGIAVSYYPTITKYNSVLSAVNIGGKIYLMDATSKYCPFGVLPAADINGTGRMVNGSGGGWVDLNAYEKFQENKNYDLKIDPEGKMTGLIADKYDGYAGIVYRNNITTEKSPGDYMRKLQENTKGLTINDFSISSLENINNPLQDTLKVEVSDNATIIGDKIMFSPLLFETIESNRYTLDERKFPVNYNYPISEHYTFTYSVPDNYIVESLPKSAYLSLPDKSISVTYNLKQDGNKIMIDYTRNITKIIFTPEEYKKLKDLYDQIVKVHSEQVILSKKS